MNEEELSPRDKALLEAMDKHSAARYAEMTRVLRETVTKDDPRSKFTKFMSSALGILCGIGTLIGAYVVFRVADAEHEMTQNNRITAVALKAENDSATRDTIQGNQIARIEERTDDRWVLMLEHMSNDEMHMTKEQKEVLAIKAVAPLTEAVSEMTIKLNKIEINQNNIIKQFDDFKEQQQRNRENK